MEKKKIAFDIDGVLYPWHELIHEYFRYFHNLSQSFSEFWVEAEQSTDENSKATMKAMANMLDVYEKRVADGDIVETLNKIAEVHDVYYITNRPPVAEFVTRQWFKRYNLPSQENLIFVEGSKLQTLKDLKIDVYVEDRPKQIEEIILDGMEIDLYVVDKPWNKRVIGLDSVTPIYHVTEMLYFIPLEEENEQR